MMDLNEWMQQERENLSTFMDWWVEERADNPDEFPIELSADDWDEQYRVWQSDVK